MRYDPRIMIFKSPVISFRTDTNYDTFHCTCLGHDLVDSMLKELIGIMRS